MKINMLYFKKGVEMNEYIENIISYQNGNIGDFKKYIKTLSNIKLLELLDVFIDYGYSLNKLKWLLQ